MIPARLTPEEEMLKAATRLLFEERGPLEAIALDTRVGKSQLATYQSRNSDHFIPVDVMLRLFTLRREENQARGDASQPELLLEVARQAGYRLVPLEAACEEDIVGCIADWSREVAEMQAAIANALRDGQICASDSAKIQREALDMLAEGKRLVASLQARVHDAGLRMRDAPRRVA